MEKKKITVETIPEAKELNTALSKMLVGNEDYNSKKIVDLINKLLEALIKVYNFGKFKYTDEQISEQLYSKSLSSKYGLYAILQSIKRVKEFIPQKPDSSIKSNMLFFYNNYFMEIFSDLNNLRINKKIVNFGIYQGVNYVDSIECYCASRSLLYGVVNINSMSIKAIMQTSRFVLRQAIELRLSRCLGIERITNNGNLFIPRRTEILEFIISSDDIKWNFKIKESILNKIIDWTNQYVHDGWTSSLWYIEWAQYMTQDMFKNSTNELIEIVQNLMCGNNSFSEQTWPIKWSIYDSISMTQDYYENHLITELKDFIIRKAHNQSITENSLEIILMKNPESLLI